MRKILPLGLILPVAATAEAAGQRQQHADRVLTKLNALIKEWNCTQLYLDVGMNVGQQVRKIYEPATFIRTHDPRLKRTPALEKAQRAIMQKSMTLFEKAFGTSHQIAREVLGVLTRVRAQPAASGQVAERSIRAEGRRCRRRSGLRRRIHSRRRDDAQLHRGASDRCEAGG